MPESNEIKDTPMLLAIISAFRNMLDIMEEFVRNTEAERLEDEAGQKKC